MYIDEMNVDEMSVHELSQDMADRWLICTAGPLQPFSSQKSSHAVAHQSSVLKAELCSRSGKARPKLGRSVTETLFTSWANELA
jgi:hypothetical protein